MREFFKTLFSGEVEKTVADEKKIDLPTFNKKTEVSAEIEKPTIAEITQNNFFNLQELVDQNQVVASESESVEKSTEENSDSDYRALANQEVVLEDNAQSAVTENFIEDLIEKVVEKNLQTSQEIKFLADNAKNILDGKIELSNSFLKAQKTKIVSQLKINEKENKLSMQELQALQRAEAMPNLKTHLGEQVNKIGEEELNNLRDKSNVLSANKAALKAVIKDAKSKELSFADISKP